MPTFKIKDLMVNLDTVGDKPQLRCLTNTVNICRCPTLFSCPLLSIRCFCPTFWGPTYIIPTTIDLTTPVQTPMEAPQDIATLRAQLKQQLALLDQQEKDQEAQLKPQTLEEVEQLEHKMKEALAEIHKMKEEFKKK